MTEQDRINSIRRNGGRHLQNFKSENITYPMCLEAVSLDGSAIEYVPRRYRTEEIYCIACKSYGEILKRVPAEYLSQSICHDAVRSSGNSLQYVPEEYITEGLCFDAVCNNPQAFQFVPADILTPSFCISIAKEKGGVGCIRYLPKRYRNASFYTALIAEDPATFWAIPRKNRTATICKKVIEKFGYSSTASAVKDNPKLLSFLHPSLYDHDACLEYVKSKYFAIMSKYGDYENHAGGDNTIERNKLLRFYDVCVEVVRANGAFIKDVPKELITKELRDIAAKNDGSTDF